jgi:poly(3-hydroxybutyrate) depolymerase
MQIIEPSLVPQLKAYCDYKKMKATFLLFALLMLLGLACPAFAVDDFPKGVVIESVPTKADPKQSYALYLPSGYTTEKKWPILYAFDPSGQGKVPVTLFKEAAEAFGYIVVGSNNSRNGLQVADIVQAFGDDTHARLSIDQKRIYTTGFSGGSRVALATALAYQPGIAGVIAASAGFPRNTPPKPGLPFVVFATVGTDDFNFSEMQQLKRELDAAGVHSRLAVFAGEHDWPPADLAMQAVAWLELQGMKSGRRERDDSLIDKWLAAGLAKARGYEANGNPYEAYLEYAALAADFKDLRDVKEVETKAALLADTKETKAAIKSERTDQDRQRDTEAKLQYLAGKLQTFPPNTDALAELNSEVSDLIRKSQEAKDSSQRRLARRILHAVFAQAYEAANGAYLAKDFAGAAAHLEIAALFSPKMPRLYYEMAVMYAKAGNKSKAITSLVTALENGFNDVARIEANAAFEPIRNESGYKKVIAALKKT